LAGPLTGKTVIIRNALKYGSRGFNAPGDSVLLYYEGDGSARSDDSWVTGRLTAVGAGACPDTKPGTLLTMDLGAFVAPQVYQPGKIEAVAPLWAYEIATYKLYQAADGYWYLGLRNASGIQPLVGPLTGSDGLVFTYYNAAGVVTNVPTAVASIQILVRGRTAQLVQMAQGGASALVDSVTTRVALRNNRRF